MSTAVCNWLRGLFIFILGRCARRHQGRAEISFERPVLEAAAPVTSGARFRHRPLQVDTVGDELSPQFLVVELDPAFVDALFAANTPSSLVGLLPPFLQQLTGHPLLRTAHPVWFPEARLVRAFRAGVSALQVVLGDSDQLLPSLALPWPDRVWIVLRSRVPPGSWITFVRADYLDFLTVDSQFDPRAVHIGFPSVVEGEAFLRGAQWEAWPVRLEPSLL